MRLLHSYDQEGSNGTVEADIASFWINGNCHIVGGKFLAWVGDIPPWTIRSLIRNRGWAVWPQDENKNNK